MKKSTLWIEKEFLLMNWISLFLSPCAHPTTKQKKISLKLVAVFYDNLLISCLFSLSVLSFWEWHSFNLGNFIFLDRFNSIFVWFNLIRILILSIFFTTFYPFFLSGTDFFVGCLDKKKILFFHVFSPSIW